MSALTDLAVTQPERQIVVVEVMTTGPNPEIHVITEVAWWDLTEGEGGRHIPVLNGGALIAADAETLRRSTYYERGLPALSGDDDLDSVHSLHWALHWSTLASANPGPVASMLARLFRVARLHPQPWERLLDVETYAAGAMGLAEPPGMAWLWDCFDVVPGGHTAEDDVRATAQVLLALRRRLGLPPLPVETEDPAETRTPREVGAR